MAFVLSAKEMARIEKLAIQDGFSEETFMTRAGAKVADVVADFIEPDFIILLLVGKGNKGGDALMAGGLLAEKGFSVHAFSPFSFKESSPLNQLMRSFYRDQGGVFLDESVDFSSYDLIVDGLLGTGFEGKLDSKLKSLIQQANESSLPIFAIDIPSGLNGTTGEGFKEAIQAAITIALGCAKSGCFLQDGWNVVGDLIVEDFGLPPAYIEQAKLLGELVDISALKTPALIRNRHKYEAGYVIGFGGSSTYSGAPKLSSLAALRSGSGIVRLFYPPGAEAKMANSFPELIHSVWEEKAWEEELKKASAVFIGPGLKTPSDLNDWFKKYVAPISQPCVLDAGALFTDPSHWPKQVVLTPHRGEALKLLHLTKTSSEEELFQACQNFSDKTGAVLVLKGAPTFIFGPKRLPMIVPHGDPGMATAGAGDVLTGIIASFLAQKLSPWDAAVSAVTFHAIAGEEAAKERGSYGMIAGDLIECLHI